MTLQKVKPGDPLVIPAPTFNTFVDAANDFLARRQDQFQGSRPAVRHSGIVLVRNDSGADRRRFDVLGIDGPVFAPADAPDTFKNAVILAGENVLDLFGGSGSMLIACEQTGRKAYLMEIDPLYADVIVQRWEKFTGKKAERVAAKDAAQVTA